MAEEQQSREPCPGRSEFRAQVPNDYVILSLDWFWYYFPHPCASTFLSSENNSQPHSLHHKKLLSKYIRSCSLYQRWVAHGNF